MVCFLQCHDGVRAYVRGQGPGPLGDLPWYQQTVALDSTTPHAPFSLHLILLIKLFPNWTVLGLVLHGRLLFLILFSMGIAERRENTSDF